MKIYLVVGETGEYSSHREWPVIAYDDEAVARKHIELAEARAAEIEKSKESRYSGPKGTNEWDPEMQTDYTGAIYCLHEIVLNAGAEEPLRP